MYRINKLLKQQKKVFHTTDLGILWGISNKNTLYTTIKRYSQKNILLPIFKGLYSTAPFHCISVHEIGQSLIHSYAYLSTESVLKQHGVIFQEIQGFTFVSGVSKKICIKETAFLYRQMDPQFLYNPIGIEKNDQFYQASLSRAVADILYYNPKYYLDYPDRVDWDEVKFVQKKVGFV